MYIGIAFTMIVNVLRLISLRHFLLDALDQEVKLLPIILVVFVVCKA